VQLEAVQLAAGDSFGALNAWGDTLEDCLQDVPVRAREVAPHVIRHGATVAVAIAPVRSGHDLRLVEPGFLEENSDDYQDLVDDFEGASIAMVDITLAEEVVNNVFLSP